MRTLEMKQLLGLGLLVLGLGCHTPEAVAPPAPPAPPARIETDVFVGGQEGPSGTTHYRIPSMVLAKDGSLLAFIEGRPSGADPGAPGDINISMKRSTDQGRTWGPVQVLSSRKDFDFSDPRPVVDETTGHVYLFFVQWPTNCAQNGDCVKPGLGDEASVLLYLKSLDHGRTWSGPVNVNPSVKDLTWRALNPGPGNGIQLRRQTPQQGGANGRLILPALIRDGQSNFHVVSVYSDDHGSTWKAAKQPTPGNGATEADLVELADGRLLLSARNDQSGPTRYHYLSADGGLTWELQPGIGGVLVSRVDASLVYAPGQPGRVLLVAPLGDPVPSERNRANLGVWVSEDEGKTFPRYTQLTTGYAAYSQGVLLPDGSLGVLVEVDPNTRVRFIRVGMGELLTKR